MSKYILKIFDKEPHKPTNVSAIHVQPTFYYTEILFRTPPTSFILESQSVVLSFPTTG